MKKNDDTLNGNWGGGGCETGGLGGITYWGLIDCDVKTCIFRKNFELLRDLMNTPY